MIKTNIQHSPTQRYDPSVISHEFAISFKFHLHFVTLSKGTFIFFFHYCSLVMMTYLVFKRRAWTLFGVTSC